MGPRIALRLVLALVLISSCGLQRPTIDLTISGTQIAGSREGSYCQSGGCSSVCADSGPLSAPIVHVSADPPYEFRFATSGEVNRIHADIFPGDGSHGQPPAYTFDLNGAERRHAVTTRLSGQYYLAVTIGWSRFTDSGDTSRFFQVDISAK